MSNRIFLLNPDFDLSHSAKYELLIRFGLDSFSYAIINPELNKVEALFDEQECQHITTKFFEQLVDDEYLNQAFAAVKAASYTPNLVNIPLPLYRPDELAIYTPYFIDSDFSTIISRPLQQHQSVFTISSMIDDLLNDQFLNPKIYNIFHPLIETIQTVNDTLMIDFNLKSFCIIYLKNGQLHFQQTYEFENAQEFNYYLQLVINQLSISPETVVLLSGAIHATNLTYQPLASNFSNISFNSPQGLNTDVINSVPAHYYTSLLALHTCA